VCISHKSAQPRWTVRNRSKSNCFAVQATQWPPSSSAHYFLRRFHFQIPAPARSFERFVFLLVVLTIERFFIRVFVCFFLFFFFTLDRLDVGCVFSLSLCLSFPPCFLRRVCVSSLSLLFFFVIFFFVSYSLVWSRFSLKSSIAKRTFMHMRKSWQLFWQKRALWRMLVIPVIRWFRVRLLATRTRATETRLPARVFQLNLSAICKLASSSMNSRLTMKVNLGRFFVVFFFLPMCTLCSHVEL
jgi:hypothetical protein